MYSKSLFTAALMLLLMPALASAGLVNVFVVTGASSGVVSPSGSGYKTGPVQITATPGNGMIIDKVTDNGVSITPSILPTTTPAFSFNAVAGATEYTIWLQDFTTSTGAATTFTPAQAGCASGTGTCSYTMATPLTVGQSYGWQVEALTSSGWQPWSNVSNFIATAAASYIIPVSSATQNVNVYFKQALTASTEVLIARTPAAVNANAGTAQKVSGQTSTISYAVTPKFRFASDPSITFTPAVATAAPSAGVVTASFTGTIPGTYDATLTLNDTTTGASNVTHFTINIISAGIAASSACLACHQGWDAAVAFPTSIHGVSTSPVVSCQSCHVGNHPATANSAGAMTCTPCHSSAGILDPFTFNAQLGTCQFCHTPTGGEPFHAFQTTSTVLGANKDSCVYCHSIAITHPGNFIEDNQGVRAITGPSGGSEFDKTSHHIVNASGGPHDAQCIVCHAEGKVVGGVVRINTANHMHTDEIYLRNGGGISQAQLAKELGGNRSTTAPDGVTSVFAWDPNTPNHNLMDQFCMSCHNANGAPTAVAAVSGAAGYTGTATNPFGDTISNGYDQVQRGVVVNVFSQYSTGNNSHHAVRGKKYTGSVRSATAGRTTVTTPGVFTTYSGAAVSPIFQSSGVIGGNGTTTGAIVASRHTNSSAGIGPLSPGSRHTIYEAGYFSAAYVPLGATASVADDSVLHCGDCHTVGQWKPGSTTDANGVATTTAIGAHGSINEYMLRTSTGIDAIHVNAEYGSETVTTAGTNIPPVGTQFGVPYNMAAGIGGPARPTNAITQTNAGEATYVCFLCHKQSVYGATEAVPFTANPTVTYGQGRMGGHGGLHPCNDPADAESTGKTGSARVNYFGGGEKGGGNLFGYTCAHCHNAGNKGFGGIHGGNASYGNYSAADGWASNSSTNASLARVQRPTYRFMGGLSLKYSGGATASKWESQVLQKSNREGCYNFAVNGNAVSSTGSATGGGTTLTGTATVPGVDFTGAVTAASLPNASNTQWRTDTASAGEFGDGTSGAQIFGTWGACGHHNGSTTSGANATSLRKVQRPLKY